MLAGVAKARIVHLNMDDDDDLDELLDEVEKKFCSNVSVASSARVSSSEAAGKCGKDDAGPRKHR